MSLCYEAGKNILNDISINARGDYENIGFIGANGVGKSTLLKLLVGLDLGFQGGIEIEGIPVTKENLHWNKSEDWICVSGFGKQAFYVKCL